MFGYRDFSGLLNSIYMGRFANLDFMSGFRKNQLSGVQDQSARRGGLNRLPLKRLLSMVNPRAGCDKIDIGARKPSPATIALPQDIYSPETLSKTSPEQAEQPQIQPSLPTQPENTLVDRRFLSLVDLKLDFNLAEFTSAVSVFTEDAEDGQIDTATLSNIDMGLHIDLKALAKLEETIRVAEGDNGHAANEFAKVKARGRKAIGVLMRARSFEAEMFYKESLKTNFKMKRHYSGDFLRVSSKLAMRYTQDFSFNIRSLNLYNSQAAALNETGEVEDYLKSAEALVDSQQTSGELIGQFFEAVQGYLDNAESATIEKVNSFFDSLAEQMGMESEYLNNSRENVLNGIRAFFDEVSQAMDSLADKYIDTNPPADQLEEPELADTDPPPIEEPEPPIETETEA